MRTRESLSEPRILLEPLYGVTYIWPTLDERGMTTVTGRMRCQYYTVAAALWPRMDSSLIREALEHYRLPPLHYNPPPGPESRP